MNFFFYHHNENWKIRMHLVTFLKWRVIKKNYKNNILKLFYK